MKKYKQLTLAQRYQIEALLQAGITQIAIQLGVHKSTISRELKRVYYSVFVDLFFFKT